MAGFVHWVVVSSVLMCCVRVCMSCATEPVEFYSLVDVRMNIKVHGYKLSRLLKLCSSYPLPKLS
jgi:hypothetical protein